MVFLCLIMLFLFIYMVYKVSKFIVILVESKVKLCGKIMWMVGVVFLVLIICFVLFQINYILVVVGKIRLDNIVYYVFLFLVFVNSCLNLFIYGLSNKNYCQGYQQILFLLYFWYIKRYGNRVVLCLISCWIDLIRLGILSQS